MTFLITALVTFAVAFVLVPVGLALAQLFCVYAIVH